MKALTLWQPWASLIAMGQKSVETRCWSTKYRGELAIHAAAKLPPKWLGASSRTDPFRDELADVFGVRRDRDDRAGKQLDFTIRTGTIFERSHVPLHKWLYAMYLLVTARKGISSMQLAKEIGITQKSAWFVLHRLREACGGKLDKLRGMVEIDECFIGGKERNKHEHKKLRAGRGSVGKTAVVGLRERGGRTIAMPLEATDQASLQSAIHANVEVGSTIFTDEAPGYIGLDGLFFRHQSVNHMAGEYRLGQASTNGIESVWAVLKRGVYGVYHQISKKHLAKYVDEFTFRLNVGNVKYHTLERLDSFVLAVVGKRLTYEGLTA